MRGPDSLELNESLLAAAVEQRPPFDGMATEVRAARRKAVQRKAAADKAAAEKAAAAAKEGGEKAAEKA